MSRYSRQCFIIGETMEDDQQEFAVWQESYKLNCKLNYSGLEPSIDPANVRRIFERSIESRVVHYISFYEGGDSQGRGRKCVWRRKGKKYEYIGNRLR